MRLKMKRKMMPAELAFKFRSHTLLSVTVIILAIAFGVGLYTELKRANVLSDMSFTPSLAGLTLVKG